jgi:FMN reductase
MSLVAVNGSPSASSRTHALAAAAVAIAGDGLLIDAGALDADALLMRGSSADVTAALEAMASASTLVLVTPVYRATFSGLLKLLLDQLPTDALADTAVVLGATGASPAHYLSLDTGLRAAVASLGGWSVPTVVYATNDDFEDGVVAPAVRSRLERALGEAARLVE